MVNLNLQLFQNPKRIIAKQTPIALTLAANQILSFSTKILEKFQEGQKKMDTLNTNNKCIKCLNHGNIIMVFFDNGLGVFEGTNIMGLLFPPL